MNEEQLRQALDEHWSATDFRGLFTYAMITSCQTCDPLEVAHSLERGIARKPS